MHMKTSAISANALFCAAAPLLSGFQNEDFNKQTFATYEEQSRAQTLPCEIPPGIRC